MQREGLLYEATMTLPRVTVATVGIETRLCSRDSLPQDLLQDSAVAHVVDVNRIVDAREAAERRALAVGADRLDLHLRPRRELVEPADGERLLPGKPERLRALAR